MLVLRAHDEHEAAAGGTHPLAHGEDAMLAGAAAALQPSDRMFPTHRQGAVALLRGLVPSREPDPLAVNVELQARPGAPYLPRAIRWAARERDRGNVALATFGDGGCTARDFREAIQAAAALQAPVVFLRTGDCWAGERAGEEIVPVDAAELYGVLAVTVDGADAVTVRAAVATAAARARADLGPTLIDAAGITGPVPHADPAEAEALQRQEPAVRLARRLIEDGELTSAELRSALTVADALFAATPRPAPPTAPPTAERTQRWVLAITSLASLMVVLDTLVVAAVLTTIRADLGASLAQLEWTVNAYTLSFAVFMMPAAVLGDRLGRRRLFLAGLALFTAASAACAFAPDIGLLIAARAVQGTGAALVMPLAMALLSATFPPDRLGRALGTFSGVAGLAVLGGPVIGGAIAEGLSWEWIFLINVPIGLLLIPFAWRRVPESRGATVAVDVVGVTLVAGAALSLVWGLVRGNTAGWGSGEVIGSLTAGALLTIAFLAWERRARQPILPTHLFRSRPFRSGNAASFMLYGALYSATFFMAQFQQSALGASPLEAGVRLLPWTVTLFLVAPRAGRLVDRVGGRVVATTGLMLQAIGLTWIGLIAEPGLPYAAMVAPMVIAGLGVSAAMPAVQKPVLGAAGPGEIGRASGTFNTMRQLGGAFGIAALVAVFAATGDYVSPQAFSDGFACAIAVAALLSAVGALAALGLDPPVSRPTPAAARPRTAAPARRFLRARRSAEAAGRAPTP